MFNRYERARERMEYGISMDKKRIPFFLSIFPRSAPRSIGSGCRMIGIPDTLRYF